MQEIVISKGNISCNFEEVKNYLDGVLKDYRGMVFTEDKKNEAKSVIADLRKQKKEFEQNVKDKKNEFLIPLNDFLAKAGELADMFDEPIAFIDGQVKAFEEQRIAEKKQLCKGIYDEYITEDDLKDIIPYNRIYNPKWENATFKEKQIREEIMNRKLDAKRAVEMITSMHSGVELKAIEIYKTSYDVADAIKYINHYLEEKEEILAREREKTRREEEERIRAEERAKIEAENKAEEEKAQAVEEAVKDTIEGFIPVQTDEPVTNYIYRLTMTATERVTVETYLNSIGIDFDTM